MLSQWGKEKMSKKHWCSGLIYQQPKEETFQIGISEKCSCDSVTCLTPYTRASKSIVCLTEYSPKLPKSLTHEVICHACCCVCASKFIVKMIKLEAQAGWTCPLSIVQNHQVYDQTPTDLISASAVLCVECYSQILARRYINLGWKTW